MRRPRRADAEIIRESVKAAEQQISVLNAEIEKLIDKRDQLQVFRDSQKALITPILELPAELLSAIFKLCLPDSIAWSPPQPLDAPLLLTQICTEWRAIAISTARLWCWVNVKLNYDRPEADTALATTWLSRSAACPLTIYFNAPNFKEHHRYPAIGTTVQHSHRWQEVCICGPLAFYDHLTSAKGHIPQVRKLTISSTDYGADARHALDTFSDAPRLYDITLNNVESDMIVLPWEQITQCSLSVDAYDCLEMLQRMTSLVNCQLEDIGDVEDAEISFRVVSHLQSLRLESYPDGLPVVFRNLILPAIRTITVDLRSDSSWPHTAFLHLIRQSPFRLERLILRGVRLMPDELISCLAELPSLVELEICYGMPRSFNCFNQTVLSRLTHRREASASEALFLLPNLRVLKLWGPMDFDDLSFADMVQSRWHEPLQHVTRLEYVGLRYLREWDHEAIARLKQFQNDGLGLFVYMVPKNDHHAYAWSEIHWA